MPVSFSYTDEELDQIHEWVKNHKCTLEEDPNFPGYKKVGAIGGEITYSFTPTGLGMISKVKCTCGAELDLTNYDW